MRLDLPEEIGRDEVADWGRHPVTKWLRLELRRQMPKGWQMINPDGYHQLHRMQGREEVLAAILELLGDE